MKQKSGFSLMEMMIVLLIVSILAAATAPMVNKRLVRRAGDGSPWNWSGIVGQSIFYDGNDGNVTASIGAVAPPQAGAQRPKLYITSAGAHSPQLSVNRGNGNDTLKLTYDANSVWLSTNLPDNGTGVVIGSNANSTADGVSIGTGVNSTGGIAIGTNTTSAGTGVAIGQPNDETNTSAVADSVALGAGAQATQGGATAVGNGANATADGAVAIHGTASGNDSITIGSGFNANTGATSANSIAIGNGSSARAQTDGIAIGSSSAVNSQSGIAIGTSAQTNGGNNGIAIGNSALSQKAGIKLGNGGSATGADSIAIGNAANATGNANVLAIGNSANANSADAIAVGSGASATTKGKTIAIGSSASATESSSIAIGSSAKATTSGNTIAIGNGANATHSNSIALGNGVSTTQNNQLMLGNGSSNYLLDHTGTQLTIGHSGGTVYVPKLKVDTLEMTSLHLTGNLQVDGTTTLGTKDPEKNSASGPTLKVNGLTWTFFSDDDHKDRPRGYIGTKNNKNQEELKLMHAARYPSDRRLKNVGAVFTGGLEQIKKIEPFHFTFKSDKAKTPQVGVMAQDLKKIFPQAVTKGEDGFLRIRTDEILYALVNAVKELDAKITALIQDNQKEIKALNKQVKELKKENQELAKRLEALEKKIK